MLSFHKRGTGVLLTWCLIGITVLYVVFVVGKNALTVDGGYSDWSDYTACSAKCAGGAMSRTRACTNPIPNYFGQNCSRLGAAIETMECNTQPCPIDGQWGEWEEWNPCSRTCGGGTRTRKRECDSPAAQYGGVPCPVEKNKEDQHCNDDKPCPVNGGYSEWGAWSTCSVSCGVGQRTRSRECTRPAPEHGGKSCVEQNIGQANDTEKCSEKPCPVNTTRPPENNRTMSMNNSLVV